MHIEFWWGNSKGRNYLKDIGVDRSIILKCKSQKKNREDRIGFIWLRTGASEGLL